MTFRRFRLSSLMLITFLGAASSCSSDCAPVNSGGVVVNVTGVSSCESITVTAIDGSNEIQFEAAIPIAADGGTVCEFQGLPGRPGTFDVQMLVNGQIAGTQSVTLDKLDECNVSSKLVEFDASSK